jgi:hypothetical protein
MGVPFVPELFVDIDYDGQGKLMSVAESDSPTEQIIHDKLTRVLEEKSSE